jgi:hypothetical protein
MSKDKMPAPEDIGDMRLIRYSMQLAMLRQLLAEKLITEREYRDVKTRLMKDYKIQSDLTS